MSTNAASAPMINYLVTAGTLRSAFEKATREDGSSYWKLIEMGDFEDVKDLVRDCHDEELPNDWRYGMFVDILDSIMDHDYLNDDKSTCWSDVSYEIADSLTDYSTSLLLQWYADIPSRIEYVNSAIDDGLISMDQVITSQLLSGQYWCIHMMVSSIMFALQLTD